MANASAVIGSAYLEVIPKLSLNPLKKASLTAGKESGASFNKSFGGAMGGVGKVATKAFKTVAVAAGAAAAAAGAATVAVGKQAFSAYASYEQLAGGINKLFGDASSIVMQNAENAYRTAGMSANEYMEQASGFAAALTNSLGGDVVKAASQADVAMRAISDNVNTFGTDIDSVTMAYQGFAKQNYTMLDNLKLGYGGTKSEMERLIADANEWGKANGGASDLSIDSFSDVITAIQQIQEAQRIAGTTAAEAGTTIQGSIDSAKAAWTNLLTEFGKDDGNLDKAMNNLVEAIIGDGTDSNKGVLGNVMPRIETIVRNVAEQLPSIIMQVAPKVGEAFVTLLDSATGGMASRVIVALSPITDAVAGVFSGLMSWYDSNRSAIDTLVQSFSNFANVVIGVVGGAIETVAPIIGDLATASIPALTAAVNFASGFVQGFANLISNLGTAVAPLVDVFAPVVDAIGTAFVDALTWAGDQMAQADFSGFAEVVSNALQTVIDFISDTVAAIGGFFDGVAKFMEDPVGAIEEGFASLMSGGTETQASVSGSFSTMNKNVDTSLSGVRKSIGTTNKTKLNDKKASAKVDGNAIDGTAKTAVSNAKKAIDSMESNSVDATVTGNAKEKTVADRIWNTVAAIKGLFSREVNVTTHYKTTGSPSGAQTKADGGIRYHANGFIANNYGSGVPLDIVGEDGAEAIIPLTNKRYVRPFADTVAEQMMQRMGGNDELIAEVKALRSDVQNMKVYLDSGALVGGISKQMDGSLGRRQALAGRGVA